MNQVEIVVALLMVVAALAIAAKRIALPYPVLLVIAGLAEAGRLGQTGTSSSSIRTIPATGICTQCGRLFSSYAIS